MKQQPAKKKKQEEGAPLWMVTFGDLMSLLLCFFILLLSFSVMDLKQYKEVAGALSNAFGVQRKVPVFDIPKGQKIITMEFDRDIIAARKLEEIGRKIKDEVATDVSYKKNMVQVNAGKDKLVIKLMGDSAFDSGLADIKYTTIPILKKIGKILKDTQGDIIVGGHTDNVPIFGSPFESNLKLSIARAATIAEFFIDKTSVDPSRVSTMGFGKYRPIASNSTSAGRKANRRVEITLTNIPSLGVFQRGK